jgi:hypothetical protein
MKNTEVKKESNAVLSKLSEEQFNKVRSTLRYRVDTFDGFYPTLNTKLLTKMKETFNKRQMSEYFKIDITEDAFVSIIKDYGSVIHSVVVDGEVEYHFFPTDLCETLNFDISAKKIVEIGVDKIEKWGEGDLDDIENNLRTHSIISEYSSLEDKVVDGTLPEHEIHVSGVRFTTGVEVSIPAPEELFPEKKVA